MQPHPHPLLTQKVSIMNIQTVGIIGAGTMGNGIAQACAVCGMDVVMVDVSEAALSKGLDAISGSLEATGQEGKAQAR